MTDEKLLTDNCCTFMEQQLFADKLRFIELFFSPSLVKLRKQYKEFKKNSADNERDAVDMVLKLEASRGYAIKNKLRSIIDDRVFTAKYGKFPNFKPVYSELAIVVIARNEGCYLDEWISYYKMMGVDHIYFIDNNSTDNTAEIIKKYTDSGYVTYIFLNGEKAQLPAYRYVLKRIKAYSKWVAFLDADEFLYSKKGSVKDCLDEYDQYPGVVVNWVVYGPCGHEKRPEGFVTDNYTLTFEDRDHELNLRVKTIAHASDIYDIRSPHYVIYKKGRLAVDENGQPMDGSNMLVPGAGKATTAHNSINKLRINHYWTKSLEELEQKCQRGYAAGKEEPQYNKILARLNYPLVEDCELADICRELRKGQTDKREIL